MDILLGIMLIVIGFHILMGMLMAVSAVGWVIYRVAQDIIRDWPINHGNRKAQP